MAQLQLVTLVLALLARALVSAAADEPLDVVALSELRFSLRRLPPVEQCERFCRGVSAMVAGEQSRPSAQLDVGRIQKALGLLGGHPALHAHLEQCARAVGAAAATTTERPELERLLSENRRLREQLRAAGERGHEHEQEEEGEEECAAAECPIHIKQSVAADPLGWLLTKTLGGKCRHPCPLPA